MFGNVAVAPGRGAVAGDLRDSVVWANPSDVQVEATSSVAYSIIEGGFPGIGNVDDDPRFWSPSAGDFHLKPSSPCIDAGDPASPLDPDGSRADMGAYPFDPAYCGEPGAYCTAKTNSQGCVPTISSSGGPSLTGPDDFHIVGTNVLNNKLGILIWSTGAAEVPFFGGTRCIATPILRAGAQNSGGNPPPDDCSGVFDFHFSQAYMGAHLVEAFTTLYAQWWYRDPRFPAPNNVGLTEGLAFTICP